MSADTRAQRPSSGTPSKGLAWLHIFADLGVVIFIVLLPNTYWEALGAGHLQGHMGYLSIALAFVYGTAIMGHGRVRAFLVERVLALGLVLVLGWGDGPQMAFMRFAFAELIALALSLGGCLVLYRFFFDFFSPEILEKRGLPRLFAMLRAYFTQGYVLPILFFGFPLLVWSGFALSVYFDAYSSLSVLAIAEAVVILGVQIHVRWMVMYRFLEENTGDGP